MQPDLPFVVVGAGAACLGMLLACGTRQRGRAQALKGVLWACFGAGLVVQGLAPNLRVERGRFVLPYEIVSRPGVTPRGLVEQERRMQMLSALLVAGSAIGLALCYREAFTGGAARVRPGVRLNSANQFPHGREAGSTVTKGPFDDDH
jgi:hypothetical protein